MGKIEIYMDHDPAEPYTVYFIRNDQNQLEIRDPRLWGDLAIRITDGLTPIAFTNWLFRVENDGLLKKIKFSGEVPYKKFDELEKLAWEADSLKEYSMDKYTVKAQEVYDLNQEFLELLGEKTTP